MLQALSYQHKVSVVFPAFPSPAFPFISVTAASSLLICWDEKDCMCYVAHVFSSLPVCKWFFGRPTVRQGTLECGDEIPVFQPLEVKCSPSSAAQPGDVSCESAHCLFCKTWHNYGSAEKQGQEKGGIYYSSHVVSFELVANGFCVVLFSRVLSSFNFSASLLALFFLLF